MNNFDYKKYLAEGRLLKEELQDDLFGEYVAQWSQGNYDYDFSDLKPGSVKGSLVDDFTLGPDEYDDDDYAKDYKMMKDYLLKNRSYELSQDEQEGLSQFPVQFSLEDDGETIKADIYYSPEYMAAVDSGDLAEGRLLKEAKEINAATINSHSDYYDLLLVNKAEFLATGKDKDSEDYMGEEAYEYLADIKPGMYQFIMWDNDGPNAASYGDKFEFVKESIYNYWGEDQFIEHFKLEKYLDPLVDQDDKYWAVFEKHMKDNLDDYYKLLNDYINKSYPDGDSSSGLALLVNGKLVAGADDKNLINDIT